jgi:hypothetical protein
MIRLSSTIWFAIFLCIVPLACNNLKAGEIAKIDYTHSGCFGSYKNKLSFFQINGNLFARLDAASKSKTIGINDSELKQLHTVIQNVKNLKRSGGCTSSIRYVISDDSGTIIREDEGCQETGFDELQRKIFGGSD